jgi:hypothetical protein
MVLHNDLNKHVMLQMNDASNQFQLIYEAENQSELTDDASGHKPYLNLN